MNELVQPEKGSEVTVCPVPNGKPELSRIEDKAVDEICEAVGRGDEVEMFGRKANVAFPFFTARGELLSFMRAQKEYSGNALAVGTNFMTRLGSMAQAAKTSEEALGISVNVYDLIRKAATGQSLTKGESEEVAGYGSLISGVSEAVCELEGKVADNRLEWLTALLLSRAFNYYDQPLITAYGDNSVEMPNVWWCRDGFKLTMNLAGNPYVFESSEAVKTLSLWYRTVDELFGSSPIRMHNNKAALYAICFGARRVTEHDLIVAGVMNIAESIAIHGEYVTHIPTMLSLQTALDMRLSRILRERLGDEMYFKANAALAQALVEHSTLFAPGSITLSQELGIRVAVPVVAP